MSPLAAAAPAPRPKRRRPPAHGRALPRVSRPAGRALERGLDLGHVGAERRRLHVRIGDREAAADIDDVHAHASPADHRPASAIASTPGQRVHALRADMEGEAQPARERPGRLQECHGCLELSAEFPGSSIAALASGQGQTHEQARPRRRFGRGYRRGFCAARPRNRARNPARRSPSRPRGSPRGLHRVHEMDFRPGEHAADQRDLEIEAQSKCRTPPAQTARSTAGSGLHFTA